MKTKSYFWFIFSFLLLIATGCVKSYEVTSVVNLCSEDIDIYYTQFIPSSSNPTPNHYHDVVKPHQELDLFDMQSVYYPGFMITTDPNLANGMDSIKSSFGTIVGIQRLVERETHEYKKGGHPFSKTVLIVRNSTF